MLGIQLTQHDNQSISMRQVVNKVHDAYCIFGGVGK